MSRSEQPAFGKLRIVSTEFSNSGSRVLRLDFVMPLLAFDRKKMCNKIVLKTLEKPACFKEALALVLRAMHEESVSHVGRAEAFYWRMRFVLG